MANALVRGDFPFWTEIPIAGRGGEDFAYPVGDDVEFGGSRNFGEIFHTPSRYVRNNDILAQMKFRFVQNHPVAWSVYEVAEFPVECRVLSPARPDMEPGGPRLEI